MPFTSGDKREKVTALTTKPANINSVTVTEALAGVDIHWSVNKPDFRLSATGSATHNDTPLGAEGLYTNFAESNAEGNLTVFRDLDETGRPDPASDSEAVFDMVKEKGSELWLLVRKGPEADEPWAAGDEYSIFHVRTDEPQNPSDRAGFIKYTVPLGVAEFTQFKTLAAAGA